TRNYFEIVFGSGGSSGHQSSGYVSSGVCHPARRHGFHQLPEFVDRSAHREPMARTAPQLLVQDHGLGEALVVLPSRYKTWRRRGCPSGRLGWSKSSAGLCVIPIFSITRRDLRFPGTVNDTSSEICKLSNASPTTARAPSVASPFPQCSADNRHPISTHGVNAASKEGIARPIKPMNQRSSRNSAAYNPKPCSTK